jgi:hypothetical protein
MDVRRVPYAPPTIRPLDLSHQEGWRREVYGTAYPRPRPELIEAAKAVAVSRPRLVE